MTLKVITCLNCNGTGRHIVPDADHFPISFGSIMRVKLEECDICEGSGVIAYKAVKTVNNEIESK